MDSDELLQETRVKYPQYEWSIDNGQVGFVHDGMFIVNPFASSPPWIGVDPQAEYGIAPEDAEKLCENNRKAPDWAW